METSEPSIPLEIAQREKARAKFLQQHPEVLRVQDALEHILVTGAKVRRDHQRRHEFEERERIRSLPREGVANDCDYDYDCPPFDMTSDARQRKRRRKMENPPPTMVCHAEDLRIYGQRYNGLLPTGRQPSGGQWNKQTKHNQGVDTEWNLEHGDSVPPILFRMARLSQEYPSEDAFGPFLRGPKASRLKSLSSTDVTLENARDVPRALMERCWERAVHIASSAVVAPVDTTSTTAEGPARVIHNNNKNGSRSQQASFLPPFDMNTPLRQDECREKCESLGVDIESLRKKEEEAAAAAASSFSSSFSPPSSLSAAAAAASTTPNCCPRCTRSFSTPEELLDHFYGTTETIGCCRPLIRPRHLDLIRTLLQTHALSQTDQLWNLVLSQEGIHPTKIKVDNNNNNNVGSRDGNAKSKSNLKSENHTTRKGPKKDLDWRDVRRCMETAVRDSTLIPIEASANRHHIDERHPVQQSMRVAAAAVGNDNDNDNDNGKPPLMLNPMVLEAANRRLIDRYADLPR